MADVFLHLFFYHKTVTLAEYYINKIRDRQKDEIYTYTFFSIYTSYTSKRERWLVSAFFFCVGDFVDRYVKYRGKYGLL